MYMEFTYIYDDEDSADDLDDYCNGCFMFGGEIFFKVNATDREIMRGLQTIYENHPEPRVKMLALKDAVISLNNKIYKNYCQ